MSDMEIEDGAGDQMQERKLVGRNPEGKVEIVTTMGKLLGFVFTMLTLFTLITGWVIRSATNELRLELQNTFLNKQDGLSRVEYDLRHKDTERAIERVEKENEQQGQALEVLRSRLDRMELKGNER